MQSKYFLAAMAAVFSLTAYGDATEPSGDIPGSADTAAVGRFEGSVILAYQGMDYDELSLPLSSLIEVEDARDDHNNRVYRPEQSIDLEGARTRLVYLTPPGVSPLQLVRNYQKMITASGGKTRYECKREECGGAIDRSSGGGGGRQSLAMYLWSESRVLEDNFTNGHCAQTERISDQRYAVLELPNGGGFVSVLAYVLDDNRYCKAFNGRTIAVVDVLETAEMGNSMVVIEPEEMAKSIAETGSVALYGIYFDTGQATLKPNSRETLASIAGLLAVSPELNLLVVGHTDNVGSFESNQILSERRAGAVVKALSDGYGVDVRRLSPVGVSSAAPKASNANEDGRTINRRVELVEN